MAALKSHVVTGDANHPAIGELAGFAIVASGATSINLREASDSGRIVFPLEIADGEVAAVFFPEHVGLRCEGGCFVEVVSGAVDRGVLYQTVR